jgi:hypothetical protein
MKISLKTKVFARYLHRGFILLAIRSWREVKKVCFFIMMIKLTTYSSQCHFARSTWSINQIGSTSPRSVANILPIGIMGWIIGLSYLLGCELLPLFDRFNYVEMIKCLMIKNSSLMQVINRCSTLVRSWSSL